jgi:hypothetical protein
MKENAKKNILQTRIKFLQKIAIASQKEVERCLAEIDAAKTEEELSLINFTAPSMPENL